MGDNETKLPIEDLANELHKVMKTIEDFIPQQTIDIQKEIKKSYENLELFTDQKKEIDESIARMAAKLDAFMADITNMLEAMDNNIAEAIN